MPPFPGKLRSLLATARIANVPSVVSNVFAGTALAVFALRADPAGLATPVLLLMLAGTLLYLCGNFFNDWKDREWDALHRPERALPQGHFPPKLYLWAGFACALAGSIMALMVSVWSGLIALAILSSIAAYTRWHKEAGWAVLPMGLCRALLPLMGVFAAVPLGEPLPDGTASIVVPHVTALFLYICGLSISARGEAKATPDTKPPLTGRLMLGLAGLFAASYWLLQTPVPTIAGLLPFAIWTGLALTLYRRPVGAHVSALLAGIPLLDAVALVPLAVLLAGPAGMDSSPFLMTCLLLPPLAFASGRLLQRVAAAT